LTPEHVVNQTLAEGRPFEIHNPLRYRNCGILPQAALLENSRQAFHLGAPRARFSIPIGENYLLYAEHLVLPTPVGAKSQFA